MASSKAPLTTLLLKTGQIFLLVNKSETVTEVKKAFVAAIRDSKGKGKEVDGGDSLMDDDEPSLVESDVPPHLRQSLSSDLVAVWKFIRDEQGQVSSVARLDDDTTLEEAGCVEAEVLGVSFESADGGFPEPVIEIPPEIQDE